MLPFDRFKELDIRIARVLEVKEHPNADRLYVIRVDVGDQEKQIVAGIRAQYTAEELIGKKLVIVNNIEPAVIRGEASEGMVLAANYENSPIVLLPEKDVPEGTPVR